MTERCRYFDHFAQLKDHRPEMLVDFISPGIIKIDNRQQDILIQPKAAHILILFQIIFPV